MGAKNTTEAFSSKVSNIAASGSEKSFRYSWMGRGSGQMSFIPSSSAILAHRVSAPDAMELSITNSEFGY